MASPRLSPALNVVVAAAQKAGRRLLRDFGEAEKLQVSVKGPGDFVSQADMRAEEILRTELSRARPGFAFHMEESGKAGAADWEWRWVVDPLDGTTNFLHGIPHWAISVGIEKRTGADTSEVVAGVIYNPAADEMFWAERGDGRLPERPAAARVRPQGPARGGVRHRHPLRRRSRARRSSARSWPRIMPQVAGVRRFGSAALDLAWTRPGATTAIGSSGIQPWDMAAGLVMVREAGGFATDPEGGDAWPGGDVVAGNPSLHGRLRDFVTEGIAPPPSSAPLVPPAAPRLNAQSPLFGPPPGG
jgi:myo-inositol-1(or 4)-monophosphatase